MEIQQGSDIKIDQNIVNAIAYTCSTFIEHLYATVVPAQK
jgi:hypothetical protein